MLVLLQPVSSSQAVAGRRRSACRRAVQEEVVARQEIESPERGADAAGVGERRLDVGAEQQEDAHPSVLERLRHPGHLVRDVVAGRALVGRGDAGEALPVRRRAVPRPHAASRDAEVAGERRQAGDGARALPAGGALVHGAPAEEDHSGPGGRVAARQGHDALGLHAGDRGGPGRVVPREVHAQCLEADGVARDECRIVSPLRDDDVHHPERQGGVRPGPEQDRLVRLRRGLGAAHVDGHHAGAAPPRRRQVAPGVGLAGEVRAPEEDERGVLAHVLLGVGPEHAGEAQAEGAEAPADDGRAPPLAAVQVGEAAQELGGNARAVAVGEQAVAGPEPDGGRPHGPRPLGDQVQRGFPADPLPRAAARRAAHGMEEALRVVDDLPRGVSADAEEAAAVRVVGVAADSDDPPVLRVHEHPAERRVAVHRTHGPDGAAGGHRARE